MRNKEPPFKTVVLLKRPDLAPRQIHTVPLLRLTASPCHTDHATAVAQDIDLAPLTVDICIHCLCHLQPRGAERFPQRSPSWDVSPDLQSGIFALQRAFSAQEMVAFPSHLVDTSRSARKVVGSILAFFLNRFRGNYHFFRLFFLL